MNEKTAGDTLDQAEAIAEAKLEKSELFLNHAQRLANLGTWSWDLSSNTWHFSDQWRIIHGVSKKRLTTEDLLPIAHPDDHDNINKEFGKAASGTSDYSVIHRIIKQDTGEIRWGPGKRFSL